MKIILLATPLFLLTACNATPPQNAVEDVSANNMIADDVTEVQDESVASPPIEAENETGNDATAENGAVVR